MKVKKIKDNITEKEYKHLIKYLLSDDIRTIRQDRLTKVFTLLYFTGLRINEATQINETKINELLEHGKTKIVATKQKIEKIVYLSEKGKREIQKYFNQEQGYTIRTERDNSINHIVLIQDTNRYLKKVFPNKNITSHSFRQTLITELANKKVGVKVIQSLVGHKNISTTYGYIQVQEDDIMNALDVR